MKIKSISLKIIITLSLSILILMIFLGYGYNLLQNFNLNNEIKESTKESLRRVTLLLTQPLFDSNYYEISNVLYIEMLSNKNIYSAYLTNKDGKLVYAAERNNTWYPVKKNTDDLGTIKGLIDLQTSKIMYKNMILGEIKIYISDRKYKETIFANIQKIILSLTFLSLIFFIVLFITLKNIIINPIVSLTVFIKSIEYSDTEYNKIIYTDSNDELGELSNRFNGLMQKLNTTINQKNSLLNQLADNNETLQREIKERIFAEEKVRSGQKYIETIFNSISSMLFTIDADFYVHEMNNEAKFFTDTFDLKKEKFSIMELGFLSQYKHTIENLIEHNKKGTINNIKYTHANSSYYYNLYITPFYYNGKKYTVLRLENITEMVMKDEQLIQTLKMESVRDLAGGIAHDFNNILGGILGSVFLAKMEIPDNEPSLLDNLDTIEQASKRATELVKQLLSISGKHSMKQRPVDLNNAIENIYKLSLNSFDKSISITFKPYTTPHPVIFGDVALIEQVILNIAINSCHAMTIMRDSSTKWGGQLTFSIEKEDYNEKIELLFPDSNSTDYWVISINDTGEGINKEDIPRIYDPFFTTKKKDKGSGLGLSIVYNIIKQHKGFISVDSTLGVGTTFKIYFPVYNDESIPDYFITDEVEVLKGNGTILVIEDEEIMRKVVREMLMKCGYEVILANDGLEGIEIFKKNPDKIRVVLLDMIMPKISGKETYKDLKGIKPDVKVILTSGFQLDERVEQTLQMGADEFIQKPYFFKELSEKVYMLMK
ncbi:MAG: hypothetical protein A2015_13590 [Spirochaetes bacterium GWF1_31_7]|nr:MAG: hypothetical protein A2Y30_11235 [Spirochaetes bacterium GWE1_32_154]OHD47922.1 MAG: hypothetical protein A2Y29_08055 [Spirochaetes bacterium GWE2_31_10]OHD49853.1 MAG: hypothetical protein A2015_13590 [Spirochaetes bacterium GWF1_31_7]OHD80651.1 MAG: hypothetical protein A2355_01240 [Spirochaetes bacterium RIFOXYB1_FULL_32_8]HBD92899.1 hypothetical protein [Spirochaetia bacterium]